MGGKDAVVLEELIHRYASPFDHHDAGTRRAEVQGLEWASFNKKLPGV